MRATAVLKEVEKKDMNLNNVQKTSSKKEVKESEQRSVKTTSKTSQKTEHESGITYNKRGMPELRTLPILKINNLTKAFGKNVVLENVKFDVKKGEIFGIIGSSGGGKTTLLKIMVGFLDADKGSVHFEQRDTMKDVHKDMNDAKMMFGFAAQEPSFYLKLKVMENLDHFGALYGMTKDERKTNSEKLLKMVNLYDSRNSLAVKLSGGMRRRLGLLTATIHKPDIFVLDEPTADLDPYSRKLVINFIRNLNKQGKTIIIASHLLEDIENLCDRIGVMFNKKLSYIGTPDELKKVYAKDKIIEVQIKSKDYNWLIKKLEAQRDAKIRDVYVENKKLYIKSEDTEALLNNLLVMIKKSGEKLVDINISRPSLNEVFDQITKVK